MCGRSYDISTKKYPLRPGRLFQGLDFHTVLFYTVEGSFLYHFFAGTLFCTAFARPKKRKKGHSRISEEKRRKFRIISFLFVSFFFKKIFHLLIFCPFRVFNKHNPTYLELYRKSVKLITEIRE